MRLYIYFILFQFGIVSAQEYRITGQVKDNSDNKPISGAIVTIKKMNKAITTSDSGRFIFHNLTTGQYIISVSFLGYETAERTIYLPQYKDSNFTVVMKPVIEDMETVVITATQSEKKLKDVPVLTQVIMPDKLKEIGITTVEAALEHEVPGLDFNTAQNSYRPSITFQGLDAQYILILLDGERIAGEMNGSIDFTRFNLSNVDRIEVVRGASSALYGSNAVGGVINIITKSPGVPLEGDAYLRLSKLNELSAGTSLSLKRNYVASMTNVVYNQSDGYDLNPKAIPTSAWTQEPFKNGTIMQRLELYPFRKLTIISNGGIYYNQLFNGRIIPADSAYSGINGYIKAVYKFNDTSNISFSYDIDDYATYDVLIKYNDNRIRTSYDYLKSLKLMSNFGFAKGMYTFGMEYLPEKLYSYRIVGQIKKESESNSFLQADYKISQNISAVAGVRATYNSIYGFNLVPKITFMARLDQTALRLSYGFGYRSPTLKELYYYFDHFGMFTLYGNQNLKPEKSQYLGFSIELNQNWISHSVNFYFNRVSDLISNNWIDAKTVQYVNDSSARIYGIDILEKVMPFKNFILSGGASYVDARNIISGRFLYDISPLSANILASYTFHTLHEKTTLEISGKYTAHRQYEPLDSIQLSDKPYNIWRANITQHYKNHFSLTLGIDNIFNTVNSKSFDNISPGRRYFVSINFKFSK